MKVYVITAGEYSDYEIYGVAADNDYCGIIRRTGKV